MKTGINKNSFIIYLVGVAIAALSIGSTVAAPNREKSKGHDYRNHNAESYTSDYSDRNSDYRTNRYDNRYKRSRRVNYPYRRVVNRRDSYRPIDYRGTRYLYKNGFFYLRDYDGVYSISTPFGLWTRDLPTRYFSVDYVNGRKIFIADGLHYRPEGRGFRLIRSPYRRNTYGGSCR